jgi:hypothetical protein
MDERVKSFVFNALNIEEIKRYEFRTICGFTFAFKKEEIRINNHLSSAEILPVGIIYEENSIDRKYGVNRKANSFGGAPLP